MWSSLNFICWPTMSAWYSESKSFDLERLRNLTIFIQQSENEAGGARNHDPHVSDLLSSPFPYPTVGSCFFILNVVTVAPTNCPSYTPLAPFPSLPSLLPDKPCRVHSPTNYRAAPEARPKAQPDPRCSPIGRAAGNGSLPLTPAGRTPAAFTRNWNRSLKAAYGFLVQDVVIDLTFSSVRLPFETLPLTEEGLYETVDYLY